MEKLYVLGDSYAAPRETRFEVHGAPKQVIDTHLAHWCFLDGLAERYELINLAEPGSGLWYAMGHHQRIQDGRMLLFVSDPHRFYHPIHGHCSGINNAEWIMHFERENSAKWLWARTLRDHYMHTQDPVKDKFVQDLLIEHLLRTTQVPVTLVSTFQDALPHGINPRNTNLVDISRMEQRHWGSEYVQELEKTHWDTRRNHLTLPNHRVLLDQILTAMADDSHVQIDPDLFTVDDPEPYLIPRG